MPNIEFQNVSFLYPSTRKNDAVEVFNNLSIIFKKNAFNVIVGPSGCGKTTLLRLITGFIDDYSGNILFDGVNSDDLSIKERNLVYVNQNYALYPHLTVFDNIAFPLKEMGAEKEEIIERVNKIAKDLGISITLSRKPKYLSGGQKQRVAIARGLVKNADIFLFDEPLSNIDANKRYELRNIIKKTVSEHRATAIYVTHDFAEAMALADYLYVMDNGNIVISGTAKEVFDSDNEIVRDFKRSTYLNYEKDNK